MESRLEENVHERNLIIPTNQQTNQPNRWALLEKKTVDNKEMSYVFVYNYLGS